MRAVILAGGRGTRLAPYTTIIPKPLLPVGDTPILEIIIRQLVAAGIDHVTLSLGYLHEYFCAFIQNRKSLHRLARIDTVDEERPSGTAGSLSKIEGLTETFLVMNGDILTTLDYGRLIAHHARETADLTIATHKKQVKINLGVLESDATNRIVDYIEKPTMDYLVSMGIYVYEPNVLEFIDPDEYLDFPDLVLRLIRAGKTVRAYPNDDTWLDLGRPEDLQQANAIVQERRADFLPEGI